MSQATHFEVQKSTNGADWVTVALITVGTTSYYHENKSNSGIAEYFKVRAVILSVPQTALPLQSAYTASDNITCTYTASTEEAGFEVHRSLDDISYSLDTTTAPNVTNAFSLGTLTGITYWFKVRAARTFPPQAALPFYSAFTTSASKLYIYNITPVPSPGVSNVTGTVYYSKVNGAANLFFADPVGIGSPTYTASTNVTASAYPVTFTGKSPSKGSIVDRLTISSSFSIGLICYKNISSLDISTKEAITFYIKPSIDIAPDTLAFVIANTNACTSIVEELFVPFLTAGEWHRVLLTLAEPENNVAILSVGLQLAEVIGACILDIYQPRYMDEFEGRKSFSITQNVDSLDATDYQSQYSKEFAAGVSSWTVSLEGHKEGAVVIDKNKEYVFAFVETPVLGQAFVGNGFFTSFTATGSVSNIMQYNYSIQGTKYLQYPLA